MRGRNEVTLCTAYATSINIVVSRLHHFCKYLHYGLQLLSKAPSQCAVEESSHLGCDSVNGQVIWSPAREIFSSTQ